MENKCWKSSKNSNPKDLKSWTKNGGYNPVRGHHGETLVFYSPNFFKKRFGHWKDMKNSDNHTKYQVEIQTPQVRSKTKKFNTRESAMRYTKKIISKC